MPKVTRQRAGVEFDLRTDPPLKEFQYRVSRFTKGVSDFSTFFSAVGEWFKTLMAKQFETEGSETGRRWTPNEPAYKAWKAEHYHQHKVGVLTGALRSAMTGGGGYSEHITATAASYGMSENSPALPYGGYFSYVRPVIRVTAKHGRETQKLAHEWLLAEARGSMGIGGSGLSESVRRGNWSARGGGSAMRAAAL